MPAQMVRLFAEYLELEAESNADAGRPDNVVELVWRYLKLRSGGVRDAPVEEDILAHSADLIRFGHQPVENVCCDRNQPRVCYPGPVMAIARFALFVLPHFLYCGIVGRRITLDRDLSCHSTDGVGTATMTGFDDQKGI